MPPSLFHRGVPRMNKQKRRCIVPIIIVYIFFSKYIINGLTVGSDK